LQTQQVINASTKKFHTHALVSLSTSREFWRDLQMASEFLAEACLKLIQKYISERGSFVSGTLLACQPSSPNTHPPNKPVIDMSKPTSKPVLVFRQRANGQPY
jgi:hypothetical protein